MIHNLTVRYLDKGNHGLNIRTSLTTSLKINIFVTEKVCREACHCVTSHIQSEYILSKQKQKQRP